MEGPRPFVKATGQRVVVAGQMPPPVGGQNLNIERTYLLLSQVPGLTVEHWRFQFTRSWSEGRKAGLWKLIELFHVIWRLGKLRLAGRIDLLIYPAGGPHLVPIVRDLVLLPLARLASRRVCVQFRAAGVAETLEKMPTLFRALCQRVYRMSATEAAVLMEFGRRDPERLGIRKIWLTPNAIEDLRGDAAIPEARSSEDGPVILSVGHLCPDKGTPQLLEAFARERAGGARLQLVGECLPPYSETELRAHIDTLGLQNEVELTGVLRGEELAQAYAAANLFVFPSVAPYESFGMVMIEAMMWGLPIVATEWRGNAQVLGNSFGGLLCNSEGDLAANLAQGLRTALEQRELWPSWGQANRVRFEQEYRIARMTHRLRGLVLDRPGTGEEKCPLLTGRPAKVSGFRVLIAGQLPPPVGGQNIAIARTLEVLRQSPALNCDHWEFRFTPTWEETRQGSWRKALELFRVIGRLIRLRAQGPIDHVIIPAGGPHLAPVVRDIFLLPIARLFCRKVSLHFHAAGIGAVFQTMPALIRVAMRAACRCVHGALVLTEFGRADADATGIRRIMVLSNGIPDCAPEFRKIWPAEAAETPPTLFHAGHLCADKGTDALIEACGQLKREGYQFRLRLAGECLPPLTDQELRRLLAENTLSEQTEICGVLSGDQLWRAYVESDLFVFSTNAPYESFGLVMVEAMRAGLPVVATDWRGNREVLGSPAGGIVCPAPSREGLIEGLRTALNEREHWADWGHANRRRFLKNFTMDRYAEALEHYLIAVPEVRSR